MADIHEIRVTHNDLPPGKRISAEMSGELVELEPPVIADVYYVSGTTEEQASQLAVTLLTNPVTQTFAVGPRDDWDDPHTVEITARDGLLNPSVWPIIKTANQLGIPVAEMARGQETSFDQSTIPDEVASTIGQIMNRETQKVRESAPTVLTPEGNPQPTRQIEIGSMSDAELEALSNQQRYGLSLAKMKAAQGEATKSFGGKIPEGNLRVLGPYWSDHCRHETTNADALVDGKVERSVFGRIRDHAKNFFEHQNVDRAFDGNAAIFHHKTPDGRTVYYYIKGETHNHPTMLEAYSGVATGAGGLLRDIVANLKRGARPIVQHVVLSTGNLDKAIDKLPAKLQTPLQIIKRGVKAISDYGNRVGVPTTSTQFVGQPGYEGKSSYLGAAAGRMEGLTPEDFGATAQPGNLLFAVGGKTGLDGIGGATGSSEAGDVETLAKTSEVQTPDAYEEVKLFEAVLEAGQAGLIEDMTDCGAGGYGLAAGELGEKVGVIWDTSLLPLKAADFDAQLKAISESQERMVLAVDPVNAETVQGIFDKHGCGAVVIGKFGHGGDNPRYTIMNGTEVVSDWEYSFLNEGMPPIQLEANYIPPKIEERVPEITDLGEAMRKVLEHHEVASTEAAVRQYDYEVQLGCVLKPFTGVNQDCRNYASVTATDIRYNDGLVSTMSANPSVTDLDPERGTEWVVDNMMAQIVAVGGDPSQVKVNNNYIMPRPSDPHEFGKMHLSVNRLLDKLGRFKTSVFTGKDSCSGEYTDENGRVIKNPYNLSLTGFVPIDDIRQTISADIKSTDSTLVLVGNLDTAGMGGSVLYDIYKGTNTHVPLNDHGMNDLEYFQRVHAINSPDNVLSCGVVGKGGIAATLSNMLFGGDCGADITLTQDSSLENILFSETAGCFVMEVPTGIDVETLFSGLPHQVIGSTKQDRELTIRNTSGQSFSQQLDELRNAWKQRYEEVFA